MTSTGGGHFVGTQKSPKALTSAMCASPMTVEGLTQPILGHGGTRSAGKINQLPGGGSGKSARPCEGSMPRGTSCISYLSRRDKDRCAPLFPDRVRLVAQAARRLRQPCEPVPVRDARGA